MVNVVVNVKSGCIVGCFTGCVFGSIGAGGVDVGGCWVVVR